MNRAVKQWVANAQIGNINTGIAYLGGQLTVLALENAPGEDSINVHYAFIEEVDTACLFLMFILVFFTCECFRLSDFGSIRCKKTR